MPVIIKRYRNRKLYNTQAKRYITLEEIEELIKQKVDVKVIDNDSDNDITASTLSQIIFGLEKNHNSVLPINLLISLVQSGGKRMDEIRRNIFNSLNLSHHFDVEIERRVNQLIINGDFDQESGMMLLEKLLSAGDEQEDLRENIEEKFVEFLKERKIPTKIDFQTLINRIETLSKKVEGISIENQINNESSKEDQIIE
jgi:polyhydroxyalkanoate synthesis repressor PhaR